MEKYNKVVIDKDGKVYFIYNRFNEAFKKEETCADVIRPVSKEDLEMYRSLTWNLESGIIEEVWKNAVMTGNTILGLEDYICDILDNLCDEEDFPYKDESYVYNLNLYHLREIVDGILDKELGIQVGTWECDSSITLVFGGETKYTIDNIIWEKDIVQ